MWSKRKPKFSGCAVFDVLNELHIEIKKTDKSKGKKKPTAVSARN